MNIKSRVSGLLRRAGLLSTAEKARYYWQRWKYKKQNDQFRKENPGFTLPPEFFIYETYRLNYKWYHDEGKNSAEEAIELLSKHIDLKKSNINILDWGCGPGRVTRHFPSLLPDARIFGSDYNEKYIEWCKDHLKGITFSLNKIDPPTNYQGDFFDIVIGLSIFTHLSEKGHFDWMNELYRIVKPGGFVLITTQGKIYYSILSTAEKKLFDSNSLVIRKYPDEGNRLYSSFQPIEFIKQLIKEKFNVVEIIPGELNNGEPAQDIWVLKKI